MPLPEHIDDAFLKTIRRKLPAWYAKHQRDLPWRKTSDPYAIWISEVMLQQTTVAAVIPYYHRWLAAFPTVADLAGAEESQVLKFWEGLGYYSRARNLLKGARAILSEHEGQFPPTVEGLRHIPGIGRYTAGAISSFAFNRRAPIVEANTLRLYARLLGYEGDLRKRDGQELVWEFAEKILPRKQPGEFNQALMELGSQVCKPKSPDCPNCPLNSCCQAFQKNLQEQIPFRPEKTPPTSLTDATVAIAGPQGYLLRKRQPGEWWAGLWDFPRYSFPTEGVHQFPALKGPTLWGNGEAFLEVVRNRLRDQLSLEIRNLRLVKEISHSVTRFRIRLLCFRGELEGAAPSQTESLRWVPVEGLQDYPLPIPGRKYAEFLLKSRNSATD